MSILEELSRLGGVASRRTLIEVTSRRDLDAAVKDGAVVRLARGRYALPSVDGARAAAHALTGVACLESAALLWGWAVKSPPELPEVALSPNRRVAAAGAVAASIRRLRLGPDDVVDGVTSRDRTLVDCLRMLEFDRALAVADSALREGFSAPRLEALVRDARGPEVARMRAVAAAASPEPANPFESVLRAIALGVQGLDVRPQVSIRRAIGRGGTRFVGRPDLVDDNLRIVLEADSFEWHGNRAALRADARRYNAFVVAGWMVLRFSWEEVMFESTHVRQVLTEAVQERTDQLGLLGPATA